MKPSVLITGISGFLGKNLIRIMDFSNYKTVYCLVRNADTQLPKTSLKNIELIYGDLKDPESYSQYLDLVDSVIHLAAVTGKDRKSEYEKVNYNSTVELIDLSKRKGVKNFLFVSTIAVKFKKKTGYHYAFSKEKAENHLIMSGLDYTILRPTIILGKGSPVFSGFYKFSHLPVIPIFGNGKNMIQPIDVADLSKIINFICQKNLFNNKIYEVGGSEKISLAKFIRKISLLEGGKKMMIKIPMFLILPFLYIADKFFYAITPVTMGQLATFRNDGIVEENKLGDEMYSSSSNLDNMLNASLAGEKKRIEIAEEQKECSLFSRYLIDTEPSSYVYEKYSEFLRRVENRPKDSFDDFLLNFGKKSQLFTGIGDTFSRFFKPDSLLRKRLGFLFAILETSPGIYKNVDIIKESSIPGLIFRFSLKGVLFAIKLVASFFILMPVKIIKSGSKNIGTSERNGNE